MRHGSRGTLSFGVSLGRSSVRRGPGVPGLPAVGSSASAMARTPRCGLHRLHHLFDVARIDAPIANQGSTTPPTVSASACSTALAAYSTRSSPTAELSRLGRGGRHRPDAEVVEAAAAGGRGDGRVDLFRRVRGEADDGGVVEQLPGRAQRKVLWPIWNTGAPQREAMSARSLMPRDGRDGAHGLQDLQEFQFLGGFIVSSRSWMMSTPPSNAASTNCSKSPCRLRASVQRYRRAVVWTSCWVMETE